MPDSDIAPVLGRIPSGIFILTIRHNDDETGMLASWVMQAGFEPPMVTLAVKKGRYVADWLAAGAEFALNIVPAEDKILLRHFGRGFEPGAPAFDGIAIERASSGVAILTDAIGHLECVAESHIDSADHRIYLARVTSGKLHRDDSPMVHVRKSGAHY